MRLQDKIVFFTGGAGEMATAAAQKMAEQGAKVVLGVLDEREHESAAAQYTNFAHRGSIRFVTGDVRSYDDMQRAVQYTVGEFGRLDALVTCAGAIRHGPIDEMSVADWQLIIDINLTGVFNICKAVVPVMKQQRYGRIVNVSSIAGRTGRPGNGVNYTAAKAGVIGMTQVLATQLAAWNITVNAIAPGPLRGKMFDSMTPEQQAASCKAAPLGRLGEMDEIAYGLLYLASDEAAWTTGEVLDINGGMFC